jgi:dienelactone hydrolase
MRTLIISATIFLLTSILQAQVKTEFVSYKDGNIELKGFFAYDKLLKSKRGGVLIVHDKYGLNKYIQDRAEELAKLGYIAFAVDMFGTDIKMDEESKSDEHLQPFFVEDQKLIPQRAELGFYNLLQHPKVDTTRIAVIGYGFGGMVAMELARSGVNLAATINFFGELSSQNSPHNNINSPLLILVGANDPKLTSDDIQIFKQDAGEQSDNWQINIYGGAFHGFTYYELGFEPKEGEAYNYNADKRSWEAAKILLLETLK